VALPDDLREEFEGEDQHDYGATSGGGGGGFGSGGSGSRGPVKLSGHRVRYRGSDLNQRVSLAYALTVHKAQGSEYPVVVVPLSSDNGRMLQRTLLYTAMSRASELLVVAASPPVLRRCVAAVEPQSRFTNLPARIRAQVAEKAQRSLLPQHQHQPQHQPQQQPRASPTVLSNSEAEAESTAKETTRGLISSSSAQQEADEAAVSAALSAAVGGSGRKAKTEKTTSSAVSIDVDEDVPF
jgi:hypothetical protein